MPPPLFRDGVLLFTQDGKLGALCLECEGAVRILWVGLNCNVLAALSIPSSYYIYENHFYNANDFPYDGEHHWIIDFQQIYENGLFDEMGEYEFTITLSGDPPPQGASMYLSFTNGSSSDSETVFPASKTVTVRLDGTITLS